MKETKEDLIQIPGKWDIPYLYSAGRVASRFFKELGTNSRIMGTRCPECKRVLVPPRSFCERCFVSIEDWVELGQEGELYSFTIVTERFLGGVEPPYAVGYVKLDGADTGIANFIKGIDYSDQKMAREKLKIGMRLRVVFKEKREGRITDFYFEPAGA